MSREGCQSCLLRRRLSYGEIAVNYGDGYETLAIKNSANEIVTFSNDATLINYIDEAVSANTKDEVTVVYSRRDCPKWR